MNGAECIVAINQNPEAQIFKIAHYCLTAVSYTHLDVYKRQVLRRKAEDFLYNEDRRMRKTGFYIVKDKFFEDMQDPYLKGNKAENRPHYYCFEDTNTGIYWMIPLSSRIDKYKRIMEKKEKAGKSCDILHIVKLDDSRESAFLIQDMFPITKNT